MAACCTTCCDSWLRRRLPDIGRGGSPALRNAADVRQAREAVLRKRARLTHHGGLLHYMLCQLDAKQAAR